VLAYPPLSWSHSRDRTLRECARRYYLQYYLSVGGWRPDAPRAARLAFALRQLTSLEAALGTAVHSRARELAVAAVSSARAPDLTTLVARSRDMLNALWRTRDRRAFMRSPREHPMLVERWYRTPVKQERLVGLRSRLKTSIAALQRSVIWDEIRSTKSGNVIVPGEPLTTTIDGAVIYATPDLLVRRDATTPWVLTEWKTNAWSAVRDQLSVYCVVLRARGTIGHAGAPLFAHVARLGTGEEEWIELNEIDLSAAMERMRQSLAKMRSLLRDPSVNEPREADAFPPSPRASRCTWCAFRTLCPEGRVAARAVDAHDRSSSPIVRTVCQ
jgi:hypothetical protein